jgi:putative ATP-dependent endonuclease of OLD family
MPKLGGRALYRGRRGHVHRVSHAPELPVLRQSGHRHQPGSGPDPVHRVERRWQDRRLPCALPVVRNHWDDRTVRIDDFHVPAAESEAPRSRTLVIEAVLAFPELDDEDESEARGAVPEFFHRMAADDHGTLKCRIVLEAIWEDDDGTVDGDVSAKLWVVRTFDETYGDDDRTAMPGAERARIQAIYVPASRDRARQVTAFLRGRLWRAAQWSEQLRDVVATSAKQVSDIFHSEAATATVETAISQRWLELHGAGTHSTPRFQLIEPDLNELLRDTELLCEPDYGGAGRPARLLSDGRRSMLHIALTTAALDIETKVADGSLAGRFDMTSAHLPTLTLLAIEEPEISLAPSICRELSVSCCRCAAAPGRKPSWLATPRAS